MDYPKINFSFNWNNKLNNSIFSTIRCYSKEKEYYYKNLLNKPFIVLLKNKKFIIASLESVEVFTLNEIPHALLMIDSGMRYFSAIKLFQKFGIGLDKKTLLLTFTR